MLVYMVVLMINAAHLSVNKTTTVDSTNNYYGVDSFRTLTLVGLHVSPPGKLVFHQAPLWQPDQSRYHGNVLLTNPLQQFHFCTVCPQISGTR